MVDSADRMVGLALGLVAVVGAIASWIKWVRPKLRNGTAQVVAVRDSILGRDAIHDSITGKEIEPALPGMGRRMAHQEEQMERLTEAVALLAKSQGRLDDHDRRIKALEDAAVERVVTKVESAEAWRAIAAAHGDPHGDTEPPATSPIES